MLERFLGMIRCCYWRRIYRRRAEVVLATQFYLDNVRSLNDCRKMLCIKVRGTLGVSGVQVIQHQNVKLKRQRGSEREWQVQCTWHLEWIWAATLLWNSNSSWVDKINLKLLKRSQAVRTMEWGNMPRLFQNATAMKQRCWLIHRFFWRDDSSAGFKIRRKAQ